jgi:hypothetical protein
MLRRGAKENKRKMYVGRETKYVKARGEEDEGYEGM